MKYMLLIYDDEVEMAGYSKDKMDSLMQQHGQLFQDMQDKGVVLAGDPLEISSTSTIVTPKPSGNFLITDGPFAETKEQLAGYYILECGNLDDAIGWAGKIPCNGHVEVRPIKAFN